MNRNSKTAYQWIGIRQGKKRMQRTSGWPVAVEEANGAVLVEWIDRSSEWIDRNCEE